LHVQPGLFPLVLDRMDETERYRDVLGQLPFLKSYTHLLLCFPISDDKDREFIVSSLEDGILKVKSSLPWLGYQVVNDGKNIRLTICPKFAPPNSSLQIRDRSNELPSFSEIFEAKGPFSMLDGSLLASVVAFPQSYEESASKPAPVISFQANFIKGGLLLDFAGQHNTMDLSGMRQCLHLLAAAMRGDEFSALELEQGNRDRRHLIPLLRPGEPLLDHSHMIIRPNPLLSSEVSPSPSRNEIIDHPIWSWHTFRFSESSLRALKELASQYTASLDPGSDQTMAFVSTNDTLCAFWWQRLSFARLARGDDTGPFKPDQLSKFNRAIDGRKALDIPPEYLGHMIHICPTKLPIGEVATRPLGYVAAELRRSLKTYNTRQMIRSIATLIAHAEDRKTIAFAATFDPNIDVGCSSWAHADVYSTDFGKLLGRPALIRRPRFSPLKGTVYFLPRNLDGDIDVIACLTQEDLEMLVLDVEFRKFAERIL
jgi:hypothetical protein